MAAGKHWLRGDPGEVTAGEGGQLQEALGIGRMEVQVKTLQTDNAVNAGQHIVCGGVQTGIREATKPVRLNLACSCESNQSKRV